VSNKSLTLQSLQQREYGFASEKDREFPNMVHLDLINVCNMRCIHCPQNNIQAHVPDYQANQLDFELFKKIIDEVAAHGATLRITCDGEPFLYRYIVEAIDYIKQTGVARATITTNGSALTRKVADAMLEPSETKLVIDFSLDGLYQPTYQKIRLRGDYVEVYGNVFFMLKNKKGNSNLRIVVNMIDQESLAEGELEAFKTFWTPIVDDVVIRTYLNVKNMVNSSEVKMPEDQFRWPCSLLWNRLSISSFGRPRFCVADWKEQAVFHSTDLQKTTIKELWQSERYEKLRRLHLGREFQKIGICKNCTDWIGLKWDYDYKVVLDRLFAKDTIEPKQRTMTNAAAP
jgi:wyosine [tRNA(Phe)-imidazoG37] synthetase (radical SAM superfamily)